MRGMIAVLVLLAGCADPSVVDGTTGGSSEEGATDAWECDYELDDYAGGQPFMMVHWDLAGDRAMSGIPFRVDLFMGGVSVEWSVTTTDCVAFPLETAGPYHIVVNQRDPEYCGWGGVADHDYQADTDTVRIEMRHECG